MTGTPPGFGERLPAPATRAIGRYRVHGEIARGGMGVVYRAEDPATGRQVALKVMLRLTNPVARRRFDREAKSLVLVRHLNVVRLLDYDVTEQGEPYMVMELVEGESLDDRLHRGGPFGWGEAVEVGKTLCGAVGACHAVGVLHRDLKPANVLVSRQGLLKLTDLGLARDVDPASSRTRLSQTGKLLGSPGFWAPEQAAGTLEAIGERTDVYGIGATLFALLTGAPPHRGESLAEILAETLQAPPPVSSLNPDAPAWLSALVGKALAVDPEARFASVAEVAAALERGAARSEGRRSPAPLVASALVVAGLLAAWQIVRSPPSASPTSPSPSRSRAEAPLPSSSTSRGEGLPSEFTTPGDGASLGAPPGQAAVSPPEADRERPEELPALLERGEELWNAGRWKEAEQAFDAAIQLAPTDGGAYLWRGCARRSQDNLMGALGDFEQAVRLSPDQAGPYFNRGSLRLLLGLDGVRQDLDQALRLDPRHVPAYANRGNLRSLLGDHEGALEDFTQAIELAPGWAGAPFGPRAKVRVALGDREGALEDLARLIQLRPNDGSAFRLRGEVRRQMFDWQGYFDDSSEAIRLAPIAADFVNRGAAKHALGDTQGALDDFNHAIELDPSEPVAYLNRGNLRGALGDAAGSVADSTEAIRLDPTLATAYADRAAAYGLLGDHERALEDYATAIRLNPSAYEPYAGRAGERARSGDLEGAVEDSTEAIRLDPTCVMAYYYRGEALSRLGRSLEAIEDLERALYLEPGFSQAREVLDWLRVQVGGSGE